MNRAARRRNERRMKKAIGDPVIVSKMIEHAELGVSERLLAVVRRTLEQEFGFGAKRLKRFTQRMRKISQETGGGEILAREGVSLDEFLSEEDIHAIQQTFKPGQ